METNYPSITTFSNVTVNTVVIRVLPSDKRRVGVVLCNRSATTLYVGNNMNVSIASGSTVRLLQNEILTLLESEGDNPSREIYAIASAATILDIVESVRY